MNRPRKGVKHYLDLMAELKVLIDNLNFGTSLVVVEGRHDEEALRRLGLRSPVARFCDSGLPFFAFVEELVADFRGLSVAILLDFDEEGQEMAGQLGRELEERGLKIGHSNRRRLAQILTREGIYRIEELTSILEKASN